MSQIFRSSTNSLARVSIVVGLVLLAASGGALFEVIRKIGRHVAQALGEKYLQRLSDAAMQLRASSRRSALVEDLTIQGVYEFVTRRGVRAWKGLRGGPMEKKSGSRAR